MKSLSISTLITAAFACFMLTACGGGEDDVVPQMTIKKPAKTTEAKSTAADEPELVPIQSLSAKKAKAAKAEKVQLPPGSVKPEEDGQYVIQVSIQSSRKAAEAIVKKLADQDIEAYIAEVENPVIFGSVTVPPRLAKTFTSPAFSLPTALANKELATVSASVIPTFISSD